MSNLSTQSNFSVSDVSSTFLGQRVYVLTGNTSSSGTTPTSLNSGNFVQAGAAVSKTTYNNLYNQSGNVLDFNLNLKPSGTTSTIYALTYGNGLYVYGGVGGVLSTSADGATWTARTSGTTSQINALTYGNGLYVYGTNLGGLSTSTDAITWTARISGTTSNINALTYGNGLYVYGSTGGGLSTSTNAITWTARTTGLTTNDNVYTVTYGNGLYVYGANTGVLKTSTDAITWTARTSGTVNNIVALKYANGMYVYIDSVGSIGYSADALDWNVKSTISGTPTALTASNSGFLVSVASNIYSSVGDIDYSTNFKIPVKSVTNPVFVTGTTDTAITQYIKATNV